MLVAGFSLVVTGDPNSTFSSILYAPLGLQEMALAVWLLVRCPCRKLHPPRLTETTSFVQARRTAAGLMELALRALRSSST
jgi:hypothetical protein